MVYILQYTCFIQFHYHMHNSFLKKSSDCLKIYPYSFYKSNVGKVKKIKFKSSQSIEEYTSAGGI